MLNQIIHLYSKWIKTGFKAYAIFLQKETTKL